MIHHKSRRDAQELGDKFALALPIDSAQLDSGRLSESEWRRVAFDWIGSSAGSDSREISGSDWRRSDLSDARDSYALMVSGWSERDYRRARHLSARQLARARAGHSAQ